VTDFCDTVNITVHPFEGSNGLEFYPRAILLAVFEDSIPLGILVLFHSVVRFIIVTIGETDLLKCVFS